MANTSPGYVRKMAAIAAIAGGVIGLVVGGVAVRNEIRGSAWWEHDRGGLSNWERVTREDAPAKFRDATNQMWIVSGFCLAVGVAGVAFYRRLGDSI